MSTIFDTQNGTILLPGGARLTLHMPQELAERQGLVFFRDYPQPAGWTLISYDPIELDGHRIYFTLRFHEQLLTKVSLAFVEGEATPIERQEQHRLYLEKDLGIPTQTLHNGLTVIYRYSWGEISASYDPRNGSSLIHVSWKELQQAE
jgi:hypothetical protein